MQRLERPAPGLQRQRPPQPSETSSRLGSACQGPERGGASSKLDTGSQGVQPGRWEERVRWDHGTIIADGRQSFHTHTSCPEECSLKSFWCPRSSHQLRASGCRGLRRSLSSKFPGCPPHPTHSPAKGPIPQAALVPGGTPPRGAPVPVLRLPRRRPRPIKGNVENEGESEKQAKDTAELSPSPAVLTRMPGMEAGLGARGKGRPPSWGPLPRHWDPQET